MSELSPEDQAAAAAALRSGDLLTRAPGDVGGGDASPMNWVLACRSCKAVLGRLGIFRLRQPATDELSKGAGFDFPYPHRIAHCTRCHQTSVVREESGKPPELARVLPEVLSPARVCLLCGGAHEPGDADRARIKV
jgi:hypothetical protein